MHCSECNHTSPSEARFCIYCGSALATTGPTTRLVQGSTSGSYYPPLSGSVGYISHQYHVGTVGNMPPDYRGTLTPSGDVLFFGGRWYKVVPQ